MAGYGTDEGLGSWLAENGYELSGDTDAVVLRQRGSAYIDGTYGAQFSGVPTGGFAQDRAWPRTGAEAYNTAIPNDVIPAPIVQASYAAAWHEDQNPGSLAVAASAASAVKREKVGSVEVEYFGASDGSAASGATVTLSAVEGLLAPFLVPEAGYGPAIFVV